MIWTLNMMKQLGVSQHNMATCSVTDAGDMLFVNTSNGVDEGHIKLPSPVRTQLHGLDKNTGKVIWTDNSPGTNMLHGQWSSPAYAVLGGVPQVMFGGGDGWLYSFLGTAENDDGKPKLLWKFDCNPKESKYVLGGRSDRNHIIGTPVIYKGLVYIGVGEDPEHGEGNGHFWCIDPTKRGDVSPELAFNLKDLKHPIPHSPQSGGDQGRGRSGPAESQLGRQSGTMRGYDLNGDGKIDFEETMHRTCGTAAIKDDLLFIADFSGLLHCLDAKTGKPHWAYDMLGGLLGLAADRRRQGLHRRRRRRHVHLQAVAEDGAALEGFRRQAGRHQHGQRRLQHADRGRQRALHRDQEHAVRDSSPEQGGREVGPACRAGPVGRRQDADGSMTTGRPFAFVRRY